MRYRSLLGSFLARARFAAPAHEPTIRLWRRRASAGPMRIARMGRAGICPIGDFTPEIVGHGKFRRRPISARAGSTAIAAVAAAMIGPVLLIVAGFAGLALVPPPAAEAAGQAPPLSGVVTERPRSVRPPSALSAAAPSVCSTAGGGNYKTDCNSQGRPVNETTISTNPFPHASAAGGAPLYVGGANDYNSYNGDAQDGYYWSDDGVVWHDRGPVDVFPHDFDFLAGDPSVDFDRRGQLFYSSLFDSRNNCNAGFGGTDTVGGMELLRQKRPPLGAFERLEIAPNTATSFQDKDALTVSHDNVFVSWTQFNFTACNRGFVSAPLKLARVPASGPLRVASILTVPGTILPQGSALAPDGKGGVWIAWEEFIDPPGIKLVHYNVRTDSFDSVRTVSPSTFRNLPSPLPGFRFRTDSFPTLTVTVTGCQNPSVAGCPHVAWTSYDAGVGRAYLWSENTGARKVADSGGDQFFPGISTGGPGRDVFVNFSQTNPLDPSDSSNNSYDHWVAHDGRVEKVSTASSFPNRDFYFGGGFIGDYQSMTVYSPPAGPSTWVPFWTDIRNQDGSYPQHGMVAPKTFTP